MSLLRMDNVTDLLTKFLDVQSLRSQTTAGNIANADTPGYIAKEVDFQDYLKEAARESSLPPYQQSRLAMTSQPRVLEQSAAAIGMDGNTVDPGREMAELAQAGSSFNFGAKMLQSRLRLLRTAIKEGR
jgi:flagellar basal-body rod protein FlgB